MRKDTAEREFESLVHRYNTAVIGGDADELARQLALPIPESVRRNPALHGRIRRSRGNAFCRMGQVDEGEREYELGFHETPAKDRGEYLLDWAMASFQRVFTSETAAEKTGAAQRCLEVLGFADAFDSAAGDDPYLRASVSCIRAFILVFVGDEAGARDALAAIRLPPLPRAYRDDNRLVSFLTQAPKGMVAALELRDTAAIRQLALGLAKEQERAFLRAGSATAGMNLLFTLGRRSGEVPKFSDSWRALVESAHLLFPRYKLFRRFRSLVMQDAPPEEIARFIDESCAGTA